MQKKIDKKFIMFIILVIIITLATVVLVVMDMKRGQEVQFKKLREEYLKRIMKMQPVQNEDQAQEADFDQIKKNLPKVDKVDYDPEK